MASFTEYRDIESESDHTSSTEKTESNNSDSDDMECPFSLEDFLQPPTEDEQRFLDNLPLEMAKLNAEEGNYTDLKNFGFSETDDLVRKIKNGKWHEKKDFRCFCFQRQYFDMQWLRRDWPETATITRDCLDRILKKHFVEPEDDGKISIN